MVELAGRGAQRRPRSPGGLSGPPATRTDSALDALDVVEPGHLVADVDKHDLFARIAEVAEVRLKTSDLPHARTMLAYHQILAYMVCKDDDVHLVLGPEDLPGQARLLNDIAKTYKGQATIYRVQTDNMDELKALYGNVAAVIVYPRFTPADILELTRNSAKLPTGITRHVIPKRALRVNLPLSLLSADTPLDDKNREFQNLVASMLKAGRIRHYQESTFMFDE